MKLAAPAKVNLSLQISGRRSDSYHLLRSLVVFLPFGDEIEAQVGTEGFSLKITGKYADQLRDTTNLIETAVRLLAQRAKDSDKIANSHSLSLNVRLHKSLPIGAGLGGGSVDAAAVLTIANKLWKVNFSMVELSELAKQLGADVVMGLHAVSGKKAVWAEGIGEQVTGIQDFPPMAILIANNNTPVLTGEVFSKYSEIGLCTKVLEGCDDAVSGETMTTMPKAWDRSPWLECRAVTDKLFVNGALPVFKSTGDVYSFLQVTGNELLKAAKLVEPSLSEVEKVLEALNSEYTGMSGSGGTFFSLFDSLAMARQAQHIVHSYAPHWFCEVAQL